MQKWLSRKLFAAAGSIVTIVLVNVGLPEEIASKITDALTWVASAYLLGQGAADAADKFRPAN